MSEEVTKKKKPWYSQWWAIVLYVIIGLIIIANMPDDEKTDLATDNKPAVTETVQNNTQTPPPVIKEPIMLQGTGNKATDFIELFEGLTKFEYTFTGDGNFGVWLLDKDGNKLELLVNEIDSTTGSKAVRIDKTGKYLLDIQADGSWTFKISQ